jgi:hypothetical protein
MALSAATIAAVPHRRTYCAHATTTTSAPHPSPSAKHLTTHRSCTAPHSHVSDPCWRSCPVATTSTTTAATHHHIPIAPWPCSKTTTTTTTAAAYRHWPCTCCGATTTCTTTCSCPSAAARAHHLALPPHELSSLRLAHLILQLLDAQCLQRHLLLRTPRTSTTTHHTTPAATTLQLARPAHTTATPAHSLATPARVVVALKLSRWLLLLLSCPGGSV